jgi:hypothetical protein
MPSALATSREGWQGGKGRNQRHKHEAHGPHPDIRMVKGGEYPAPPAKGVSEARPYTTKSRKMTTTNEKMPRPSASAAPISARVN